MSISVISPFCGRKRLILPFYRKSLIYGMKNEDSVETKEEPRQESPKLLFTKQEVVKQKPVPTEIQKPTQPKQEIQKPKERQEIVKATPTPKEIQPKKVPKFQTKVKPSPFLKNENNNEEQNVEKLKTKVKEKEKKNKVNEFTRQTLSILGEGNQEEVLNEIKQVSPENKYLPAVAFFYKQDEDLQSIGQYVKKLKKLVDKKKITYQPLGKNGVKLNNEPIDDWLKFTEVIDGVANLEEPKKQSVKLDDIEDEINDPPLFESDDIVVYGTHKEDDPTATNKACIKYGRGYSYCISNPNQRMRQRYRDTQDSTFYFVFDKKRPKSDPLHNVVVDITKNGPLLTDANNNTGTIAEFGQDPKAYLEYLKEQGVPADIFKNIPKSEKEKEEQTKLGKQNKDFDWFIKLTPEEKSRYIGRGHILTKKQFDLLWKNNQMDLLNQYVTTGNNFEGEVLDKVLSNNNLKKSYLRSRLQTLGMNHVEPLNRKEFEVLPKDKQDEVLKKEEEDSRAEPDTYLTALAKLGQTDLFKKAYQEDKAYIRRSRVIGMIDSAAEANSPELVDFILNKNGEDFEIHRDTLRSKAFESACYNESEDVINYLLKLGEINEYLLDRQLIESGKLGQLKTLDLLFNYIKNNYKDPEEIQNVVYDTIVFAAKKGQDEAFEYLWNNYVADSKGKTVYWGDFVNDDLFQPSVSFGQNSIVQFIVSHVNSEDLNFRVALINSSRNGNIKLMKLLLKKGKINTEDKNDALLESVVLNKLDSAKLLLDNGADDFIQALRRVNSIEMQELIEKYQQKHPK